MSRQVWRDQVTEDAIEPELRIVDAHHHVWEGEPYPGFDPYDDAALIADKTLHGHRIIGTVFTDSHTSYLPDGPEERRSLGETAYAERIAQAALERGNGAAGICAAIAPGVDLTVGSRIGDVLDAHAAVSPRFRGIRHMTAYDPDVPATAGTGPGVMKSASFREGFAELVRRGLSFDAWLLQSQITEVIDLAGAFPDAVIILDHLGGPLAIGRFADRAASFSAWRRDMADLATCANVRVKLGGLNMGLAGVDALGRDRPFTSDEMVAAQRDYILTAIELFEPARCMFESNAPVDLNGIGYGVIWNGFKKMTADFTAQERGMLFSGTAIDTYRIDPAMLGA
jgi:predicted TIM-barrel fold metal-dependent hydrolase